MASCVFALSVLAVLTGCSRAHEVTEQEIYSSETWHSDSPIVLVRAQDDVYLLEEWFEGTNVPIVQVSCDAAAPSDLCTLFISHSVVVRREGRVLEEVAGEIGNNETTVAVMEKLFGPEFHLISDYSAMKEFQDSHPRHVLAFARSHKSKGPSEKYLFFLKALLTVKERSAHIAVTKDALALPLSHRPKHSKSAELFLWLVSDDMWCQYGNSSHPLLIVNGMAAFYKRITIPFVVRYTTEGLTSEYRDKGLFTSYVIHSPSKKKLAERVVSQFIEHYCNFFMFLLVEKSSRKHKLTSDLYLSAGENNIIVIEPPLLDMPPIHLNLEGIEEQDMVTMLAPIQEEFMELYMINADTGKPARSRRKVVVTDPLTVGLMVREAGEDMMIAFCDEKEDQVCGHFEQSLQQVADIITTSIYQRQELGFALVRTGSLDDIREYGVTEFPFISYYNSSSSEWSEIQQSNFQDIINRALGQPEQTMEEKAQRMEQEKEWDEEQKKFLKGNKPDKKLLKEAEKISREYQDPKPPEDAIPPHMADHPPPPSLPTGTNEAEFTPSSEDSYGPQTQAIIEDDDHFGQLSFSLGDPDFPDELVLSDDTFGVHINRHTRTMVTFYVPWEPHCDAVMHYMLQALEDLPDDSLSSLAVLNCADYPDLCGHYSIIHYPTILLFRASPNDWVPFKGMIDSRVILRVLQGTVEEKDGLLELTASTLPRLLSGDTLSQSVLVVWAREGVSEGDSKEGSWEKEMTNLSDAEEYSNFSFAWINCKEHKDLLLKVFQDFNCESLLLLDFQQRSVYLLPPSEWQTKDSLAMAVQDFLSQYMTGVLTASGKLIDGAWPPLQPPIKFPSTVKNHQAGDETPPPPPPPPTLTSPPPLQPTPSPDHHTHTEL